MSSKKNCIKNYKLSLREFIDLLEIYTKFEDLYFFMDSYFTGRISYQLICDSRELELLEKFAVDVKNSFVYDKKVKREILGKIEMLFVLSKDGNRYNKFLKLKNKKISELSADEILYYIDILLSNCYCCIVISKLDGYIRRYLELSSDINNLEDVINKHSNLFTGREMKYLKKFIYDNDINIILRDVMEELGKDRISSLKIYRCFSKLSLINFDLLSNNSLVLFRDVINKISDVCLLNRVDDKELFSRVGDIINEMNVVKKNGGYEDASIRSDIVTGKLKLNNIFSAGCMDSIRIVSYDLPIIDDRRIITIDDEYSPDLDGAFSISKKGDVYNLDVYISDVPVFLRDNRKLSEEAYLRGCSMYVRDYMTGRNYNIDMLPQFLSHKYLSLKGDSLKNVIVFSFTIGVDGLIYSTEVSRKTVRITNRLTPQDALMMINSDKYFGMIQEDLREYKKICEVVCNNTGDEFLSRLNHNKISDLVAFTSVLVNYYIGHEAEFAIYRENGKYGVNGRNNYTHSVTPIRKFVSNINLAFFLEQNGVVHFSNRDLYYVQSNVDEIISHLNSKEEISRFVDRNSKFVRKYIK